MKDRYYQPKIHEAFVDFVLNKVGNFFLYLCGGAGKTVSIAKMIKQCVEEWKGNVLNITHTQELVMQNYKTACRYWPEGRRFYGINSASLNCRDYNKKAIFGTINSVYRDAGKFPKINLLLIDEAQRVMIGKYAGMYRKLINDLLKLNPKMKIGGLSAQDWREVEGSIIGWSRDHVFNEVIYRITNTELVANKYLTPLVNKASKKEARPDVSQVPIGQNGDFIEDILENVVISKELIKAQVDEIMSTIEDRRCPLIFCLTIKHADLVQNELKSRDQTFVNVNYKTEKEDRKNAFKDFYSYKKKFLINVRVAMVGYDNDRIGHITFLAPWGSLGDYIQGSARGSRVEKVICECGIESNDFWPCECGKEVKRFKKDCYICDPAGNISRHGSIDEIEAPDFKIPPKIKTFKKCPECFEEVAKHLKQCPFCKLVFESQEQQRRSSGKDTTSIPILKEPVWMDVSKIQVSKSTKNPRTHIIANFYCGGAKLLQNIELKNPSPEEKWAVDIEHKIGLGTEYCRMKLDRYAKKPNKVQVLSDHGNLKIIGVQC